jgi:hypothetical protein
MLKGLTICPTFLIVQYTNCIIFIPVFLDFSLCSATCSCIPGVKGADRILFFFCKVFLWNLPLVNYIEKFLIAKMFLGHFNFFLQLLMVVILSYQTIISSGTSEIFHASCFLLMTCCSSNKHNFIDHPTNIDS